MPELPEVEHLRTTLEEELLGATIEEVVLGRHNVTARSDRRQARTGRGDAAPSLHHDLLLQAEVSELVRHGKQMAMVARDGRVLVVQLGMSGRMVFQPRPPGPDDVHAHVAWRIKPTARRRRRSSRLAWLVFRDPRRFGGLTALPAVDDLAARWDCLGPDALVTAQDRLVGQLRPLRRQAKAALLDQAVLAGVGNIYADEALFRSGVHPMQLLTRLSETKLVSLVAALQATLQAAVDSGGSTLRDYVDAKERSGDFQSYHLVYGRAGQPCPQCGRSLEGSVVAGRTTVRCPSCQRLVHNRR